MTRLLEMLWAAKKKTHTQWSFRWYKMTFDWLGGGLFNHDLTSYLIHVGWTLMPTYIVSLSVIWVWGQCKDLENKGMRTNTFFSPYIIRHPSSNRPRLCNLTTNIISANSNPFLEQEAQGNKMRSSHYTLYCKRCDFHDITFYSNANYN